MKVIVSLTTTYERSGLLHDSIHSLLKQDKAPDIVMLNISDHPYLKDSGFSDIPAWLKDLPVSVNWVENTGPYRKLLPAIKLAGAHDRVITADDDIIYGRSWLRDLVDACNRASYEVVCCRARKMKKNFFGGWQNYRNWPLLEKNTRGINVLATSGGGVVYSRKVLDLDFLFNPKFLEIAPVNDDLWYKMASLRQNSPTQVHPGIDADNRYIRHKQGLDRDNFNRIQTRNRLKKFGQRTFIQAKNYLGVNQTKNDTAWDAVCEYSKSMPVGGEHREY